MNPNRRSVFASGNSLTIGDLPLPNTMRWSLRSKVAVVAAVESGLISFQEASKNYSLSHEEFCSWRNLDDSFGLREKRSSRSAIRESADHLELHF